MILGGETNQYHQRVNVRDGDIRSVLQAALGLFGSERLLVRSREQWQRPLTKELIDKVALPGSSVDLLILDANTILQPDNDQTGTQVTGLLVEVIAWTEHSGAYSDLYLESTRSNAVAKRLRPSSFERLAQERHNFAASIPPADMPSFPVDVVYTWVDGDDPAWLDRKELAQANNSANNGNGKVADEERFRSRDELKYSLRSLQTFAPWVRTIHIVTAGQCPAWLNTNHPKIRLVDHKEIYSDEKCLPTFNSSGIETQLHHVPNLADKFLYFNDDFFLGQYCEISDFFFGNGILKYFPSGQMAYEFDIDSSSEEYIQADKNVIELLSRDYQAVNRHIMRHAPYASDRALLQEMEERYPREFANCASAKFRSSRDIRPVAFMQYHYGFNKQKAVPAELSHRYLALWKETVIEQMGNVLKSKKYKTFCINDVGLQPERTKEVNEAVVNFLESYFPVPSLFEL